MENLRQATRQNVHKGVVNQTMRVLGFSQKWNKLHLELPIDRRPYFTTYRLLGKDTGRGGGCRLGEVVQIVYKPRSPHREILGTAKIIGMHPCSLAEITDTEAWEDGFENYQAMVDWFVKTYGKDIGQKALIGLMLRWEVEAVEAAADNLSCHDVS